MIWRPFTVHGATARWFTAEMIRSPAKANFAIFALPMTLIPITRSSDQARHLFNHPDCREVLEMFPRRYRDHGFTPPWIGYLVFDGEIIVGSCGFKNIPVDGKVEIAYWTFKEFEHRGIATSSCAHLVNISLSANPSLIITARTSSVNNTSSRILRKNGFSHTGMVYDDECGDIYEWTYQHLNSPCDKN
jgi:[ribosomal protein S5]-alanine N-acetyltransferase